MKPSIRILTLFVVGLILTTSAWAQWSSDPLQNLALSNIPGADQVQPKLLPLPNNSWYVSWFNNNPNDPPPNGYDVYYQLLSANGVEQFQHDGVQVAKLTFSSTEDYGLAIDADGNALLAFQDDRQRSRQPADYGRQDEPDGPASVGTHRRGADLGPKLQRVAQGNRNQRWRNRGGLDVGQ